MTQAVARIGRPRRLAVDVVAVANLVGTLAKYLGVVTVFPIALALWYGDPVWPYIVTGLGTSAFGFALERLTARAHPHARSARGVPRRLRDAAHDGGVRVAPVPLRRRRAARPPDRRVPRRDVGGDDDRRERGHRLRRVFADARDVAAVHPVARRARDHHPRGGDPPAAARRRAADDGVRAARARDRRARRANPSSSRGCCGRSTSR